MQFEIADDSCILQGKVEGDTSRKLKRPRCVVTERCRGGFLLLFLKAAGEFAAERSSLESKIQSLQGTRMVNRTMLYINTTVPGHVRNGKKNPNRSLGKRELDLSLGKLKLSEMKLFVQHYGANVSSGIFPRTRRA